MLSKSQGADRIYLNKTDRHHLNLVKRKSRHQQIKGIILAGIILFIVSLIFW